MLSDPIDDLLTNVAPAGLICYDADCAVCRRAVRWLRRLTRHGFAFIPLQHPMVRRRLGSGDIPNEFKLIRAGDITGGALAITEVLQSMTVTRPLARLARTKMGFALLDAIYRWIATHRHCHAIHVCGLSRANLGDRIWMAAMIGVMSDWFGDGL